VEGNGCGLIKVLSQYLDGGTEENHKNLTQNSQCPSQDSSKAPPEYSIKSVTARPAYWVTNFFIAVLHAKCFYVSVIVCHFKTIILTTNAQ
jgi:hypothetical protein